MCRLTADWMTGRCNKMQIFHELQHFRDQLIIQHRVPHHKLCFRDQLINQNKVPGHELRLFQDQLINQNSSSLWTQTVLWVARCSWHTTLPQCQTVESPMRPLSWAPSCASAAFPRARSAPTSSSTTHPRTPNRNMTSQSPISGL